MKYCQKCGKELADEAVVCVGCGCPVEAPKAAPATKSVNFDFNKILEFLKAFFADKTKRLIAIIAAAILVLGIFTISIFDRPNLNLNNIQKHTSAFGAVMQFGLPNNEERVLTEDDEGNTYLYENCVKFYGIPVEFAYCTYTDAEYNDAGDLDLWFENEKDFKKALKIIEDKCELEDEGLWYDYYSYKDMEISVGYKYYTIDFSFED